MYGIIRKIIIKRKFYFTTKTTTTILQLFILINLINNTFGKLQLCEHESGQTNIILDIEESRGNSIDQLTIPSELPIHGDPSTEISLELSFPKGEEIFTLNNKTLKLTRPLDRDENNLSHIVLQVSCTIRKTRRKRNIPIIVRVSDINDNAPVFVNTPYQTTLSESTPVGKTIFTDIHAVDNDAGVNGLVEYFLVEGNFTNQDDTLTSADGFGTFSIAFPHQGQVTTVKSLDYEKIQRYYLTIIASDRARNTSERLTATTTLTINIADADDLDPSFIYRGCILLDGACINPEYSASVPSGTLQGVLSISPERIQAIDLDTISSPIRYSFLNGDPQNFNQFFEIDEHTGILKQIKVVNTTITKKFNILVKAEEVSESKRFTTAKLIITVKPVDSNPPVITASSLEGFVDENSPIGTVVVDKNGFPMTLTTTDADLVDNEQKMKYIYEVTTPFFTVSENGTILVNSEGLDRDPPNPSEIKFQVVAREETGNAASAPLSLKIKLNDINDNPPKISMVEPITIIAGDGKRFVVKINATDNDDGENAIVTYSILHVSNNGIQKFTIDKNTGVIETNGLLNAGEQYSITVQAQDRTDLHSQAIVEITVSPGPNTKPPKFIKSVYDVQVSEGAEINSTVTVVKAEDPENDPVKYFITSGNDLRQFSVSPESGVISVIRKLDREDLTRYQLHIKAEDNGGLSNTATVNIKVTDINDNNPQFEEDMYTFRIDEGKSNAFVGIVHANDADEGINSEVIYDIPTDIPFKIDQKTGEIRTESKLDYENKTDYKFVVTAKDGAPDMRLGTASVLIRVTDIEDELPKFMEPTMNVKVPENVPDLLIATVKAFDPDTIKRVTYVIKQGDIDLFKVDPKSGQVKTIKGLDYEKDKSHELIIGTLENNGTGPLNTMKLTIDVDDRNDNQPVFVSVPEPIVISNDKPIGSIIGSMLAIDGDSTSPGNIVRYEMVGRGKALKYFQVDTDTGVIRIRDTLGKENDTEYQIDVRAYDLGEPQLSSVATLPVFVRQSEEDFISSPIESMQTIINKTNTHTGIGFTDETYTFDISESTKPNSTIKLIKILNVKNSIQSNTNPEFMCQVIKGDLRKFSSVFQNNSCTIKLLTELDYENSKDHEIIISLKSNKYLVNPQKSSTKIKINVKDENDNQPEFIFNKYLPVNARNDTYYAAVNHNIDIDKEILKIKAIDKDSGKFGMIKYRLLDDLDDNSIYSGNLTSYFTISEDSGVIKTKKKLLEIKSSPIHLIVEARDNNGSNKGIFHTKNARIVINLISDINRMALMFSDSPPDNLRNFSQNLEELLSEKSNGLIVFIEKFSPRKLLTQNGSIVENPKATDVWFYAIDPESERILSRNSTKVNLLKPQIQSQINFAASGLVRATAQGIYGPLEPKNQTYKIETVIASINSDLFPYALIALAVLILILGIIGIIYISVSWSRYKSLKHHVRQYVTPTNPVAYNPVIITQQPANDSPTNLKEYETQVLAMAVPNDEMDEMRMEYGIKNQAFCLDNVSYITHKENGQSSVANSEATLPLTATLPRYKNNNSLNSNSNHNNNINSNNNSINNVINNNTNNRQNTFNRTLEMNRNNSVISGAIDNQNALLSTLTLGRLKSDRHNSINGYRDSNRNVSALQNNHFATLDRRSHYNCNTNYNDLGANTLGRNNRHYQPSISKSISQRNIHELNASTTNDNVVFGKRDINPLGFNYLNDFDRSEIETTTEL